MRENQINLNNILCVGNVSVDIKAFSIEDEGTEAYRDGTIDIVPGGVGRGMAINLKHLGLNTHIYSYIGSDIFGNFIKKDLEDEKVNTSLLKTSTKNSTSLFSVMASPNKSASCVYNTKNMLEVEFTKETEQYIKDNNIGTIVLDSNLSEEGLKGFYDYKKSHPEIFIFQNATAPDIAKKSLPYANLIDLFACNEYEAQAILGQEVAPDLETADKMQQLGFNTFIITFGERGVMVRSQNNTWNEKPFFTPHIVDTIGAGDAFASGFLMGYLNNENIKRCIHYGLACSKETLMTRQTVSSLLSKTYLEEVLAKN